MKFVNLTVVVAVLRVLKLVKFAAKAIYALNLSNPGHFSPKLNCIIIAGLDEFSDFFRARYGVFA